MQNKHINNTWQQKGQICWIEPQDKSQCQYESQVFIEGSIVETTQFSFKIQLENTKNIIDIHPRRVYQRVQENQRQNCNDLVNMECLNDAEVLYNLKKRYENNQIQTYVGPTLLVVNPFKFISNLYDLEVIELYYNYIIKNSHSGTIAYKDLQPHVYAIAGEAYKLLFENNKNQAIVISGESGAGKTVNTKHAMQFLTQISNFQQQQSQQQNNIKQGIEQRILSCNPVLEALGNSKTCMNDNSSRFGKYVTLIVEKANKKIIGAKIHSYLLEKSRVVGPGPGERGFHVFYHMIFGADDAFFEKYKFNKLIKSKPEYFNYLKKSQVYQVNTIDDTQLFQELLQALDVLKFSEEQKNFLWSTISAVLWLGNLEFDDEQDNEKCVITNTKTLEMISELLDLSIEDLQKALTFKRIVQKQRNEIMFSPYKLQDCYNCRDSMAKDLYYKLFLYIIDILNQTILPEEDNFTENDLKNNKKYCSIGILDIYGFEVFKKNGFEQFFINYTNEKLQQLYIQYVFKEEKEVFKMEQLQEHLQSLVFEDNQAIIHLMNLDIFNQLDEGCKMVYNDQRFHGNLKDKLKLNKNIKFSKFGGTTDFTIKHTATDVEYDCVGFVEKNKDRIDDFVIDLFISSSDPILKSIYYNVQQQIEQDTQQRRARFSSTKFRIEMDNLIQDLMSCDVHFIRCLKPNEQKEQNNWNDELCINQIRYLGVLESVKVRKEGYPIRRKYMGFYQKYGLIMEGHKSFLEYEQDPNTDFKLLTMDIFDSHFQEFTDHERLFGKTKIFLRQGALKYIDEYFQQKMIKFREIVQKFRDRFFRFKQLKKFRAFLKVLHRIQRQYKISQMIRSFHHFKRESLRIQKWYKNILKERKRKYLRQSAIILQNFIKKKQKSIQHQKKLASVTKIQRQWKVQIKRKKLNHYIYLKKQIKNIAFQHAWHRIQNKNSITIQKNYRGYRTRKIHAQEVARIKYVGILVRWNKAALKIQKHVRGYLVRSSILRIDRASKFIQGYMRMHWLSQFFRRLRASTIKIQIFIRKYFIKRHVKEQCFQEYFQPALERFQHFQEVENEHIFGGYNQQLQQQNNNHLKFKSQDQLIQKSHEQYFNKKIYLFSYLTDLEYMADVSDIYDTFWSQYYLQVYKECYDKINYVQYAQVGEAHTVIVSQNGKINTFGLNDQGQLGVNLEQQITIQNENQLQYQKNLNIFTITPQGGIRPKMISSGKNHNLLLDAQGTIYTWGSNSHGQLGQDKNDVEFQSNLEKITVINHSQNQLVDFKYVKASGNKSFAICEEGKVYTWPWKVNKKLTHIPYKLNIPKIQISHLDCGHEFTILQSTNGLLYSFGKNNNLGQLGQGHQRSIKEPQLIESLRDAGEKIVSIGCGYAHTVAATSLGRVYTFGWGQCGQLGHGDFTNQLSPKWLKSPQTNNNKIQQVCAGYRSTYLLSQNRKIYQFGMSQNNMDKKIILQPEEIHINSSSYKKKNPLNIANSIYEPVRIYTAWSTTKSLFFVTYANTGEAFKKQPVVKSKIINTITQQWTKQQVNSIDPPFMESVGNYVSEKNMKMPMPKMQKPIFVSKKIVNDLQKEVQETQKSLQLQQLTQLKLLANNKENLQDIKEVEELDQSSIQSSDYDTKSFYHKENLQDVMNYTQNLRGLQQQFQQDQTIKVQDILKQQQQQDYQINVINCDDSLRSDAGKQNFHQNNPEYNQQFSSSPSQDKILRIREMKLRVQELNSLPQEQLTPEDLQFLQMASEFDFDQIEIMELKKLQEQQDKYDSEQFQNIELQIQQQQLQQEINQENNISKNSNSLGLPQHNSKKSTQRIIQDKINDQLNNINTSSQDNNHNKNSINKSQQQQIQSNPKILHNQNSLYSLNSNNNNNNANNSSNYIKVNHVEFIKNSNPPSLSQSLNGKIYPQHDHILQNTTNTINESQQLEIPPPISLLQNSNNQSQQNHSNNNQNLMNSNEISKISNSSQNLLQNSKNKRQKSQEKQQLLQKIQNIKQELDNLNTKSDHQTSTDRLQKFQDQGDMLIDNMNQVLNNQNNTNINYLYDTTATNSTQQQQSQQFPQFQSQQQKQKQQQQQLTNQSSVNVSQQSQQQASQQQQLGDGYEYKLQEILKKMKHLQQIPKQQWSHTDIQFMKLASSPQVQQQLQQLFSQK